MKKSVAVALLAALALVGCANTPRKAFNREGASQIKTVAVAQRTAKESYNINIVAHPGLNFGLVGGLVAAADLSSKSTKLTSALDPAQTELQKRLTARVAEKLAGAGYLTSVLSVAPTTDEGKAFETVRSKLSADAFVDLNITGGYTAAGPDSEYLPFLRVAILGKEAKSGNTMYQDLITYGYTHQGVQSVHLESDTRYRFKSIDDLLAQSDLARQGLLVGIDLVATQVANDLKR